MPHGYRLRIGRVSEIGRGYLITTVTHERQKFFSEFTSARSVIGELRHCDEIGLCNTLAFVLMPDHLHWLLQLRAGSLSKLVKRFKSRSAKNLNEMASMIGRQVWQEGFHDHAIRDNEDIQGIARYIVANPLRAGIVRSVRDYPHWDAVWL